MNRARIAALLREQARIVNELAEEFARDAPAEDPQPVRVRRPPITDLDKARARKALRRLGMDV